MVTSMAQGRPTGTGKSAWQGDGAGLPTAGWPRPPPAGHQHARHGAQSLGTAATKWTKTTPESMSMRPASRTKGRAATDRPVPQSPARSRQRPGRPRQGARDQDARGPMQPLPARRAPHLRPRLPPARTMMPKAPPGRPRGRQAGSGRSATWGYPRRNWQGKEDSIPLEAEAAQAHGLSARFDLGNAGLLQDLHPRRQLFRWLADHLLE